MRIIKPENNRVTVPFSDVSIDATFEFGGQLYTKTSDIMSGTNAWHFGEWGISPASFHRHQACILVDVTISYDYSSKSSKEKSE